MSKFLHVNKLYRIFLSGGDRIREVRFNRDNKRFCIECDFNNEKDKYTLYYGKKFRLYFRVSDGGIVQLAMREVGKSHE